MVKSEKMSAALYAIHSVLVKARWLVGNRADPALIYRVLDWAEVLPALLARRGDDTEEFRDSLAQLGTECPECAGVLQNFDRGVCWEPAPAHGANAS